MPKTRDELRDAVHVMLNDVVERCFTHLIHHPQHSDDLSTVIKETSDDLNYFMLKIDAHNFEKGSKELEDYYNEISSEVHRKSLHLMMRLQRVQKGINVSDGQP